MNSSLRKHLWRSPVVRLALRRELLRLCGFIAIYVVTICAARWLAEKPLGEAFGSALVGAVAIAFCWLVQLVRTAHRALRDHAAP